MFGAHEITKFILYIIIYNKFIINSFIEMNTTYIPGWGDSSTNNRIKLPVYI